MPIIKVNVDETKFEPFGWIPTFDVDAYDELIHGELRIPTPDEQLTVHIAPHSQLKPETGSVELRPFGRVKVGSYDEKGNIHVNIVHSAEQSNRALLHETKHWLDDMHGIYTQSDRRRYRIGKALKCIGITVPIAIADTELTYLLTQSEIAATVVNALTYLGAYLYMDRHLLYSKSPWETEAREFAEDAERFAKYGSIITHSQYGSIHQDS